VATSIGQINSSSFREFSTWLVFWANELRRPIVVVTNQSGVGRGYFDENAYTKLTRWMCDRFEAEHTASS
jgi:histidinol phosphatase-like enzyme